MKKLFYIVLVIVVLLVISKLVKNEAPVINEEPAAVVIDENVTAQMLPETDSNGEALVAEPVNPDAIGDGEVVEEEAEEVIEENPSATADEDETIIKE